ncbi:MAG: NAD(P)H-hydrate dehydratase, partial [Bacteroidia bacterium]|nr:NAD(P)H-hydrate dehydratase [Bacteroidia bacterium]
TKSWPILLSCKEDFPTINRDDIIVDAVFGIGLNRPVDDWIKTLFQNFRNSGAFTLAVDMPSGLYSNRVPEDETGVVWANHTLSFASPKLVFFLPDTAKYTQQWEILDIGLDQDFLFSTPTEAELIGKFEVMPLYKPRGKFAHKGDFGHALIVGGSYGKIGAVILSSRAALQIGAGLVTAFLPKCGYVVLQTAIPEVMVITDEQEKQISNISFDFDPTVVGIGIGLGTSKITTTALKAFLKNNNKPLVIDADALNILATDMPLLKSLPPKSILTPHPKELERLVGAWTDDFDKLEKSKTFAREHNVILIIKGAHTITIFEDKLFINSTGNPGMATAGAGDVLTGTLTGLVSQGYDPLNAAIFGVYLHGRAGDMATQHLGYEGMMASDITDNLGQAIIDLFRQPEPVEQAEEEENKEEV